MALRMKGLEWEYSLPCYINSAPRKNFVFCSCNLELCWIIEFNSHKKKKMLLFNWKLRIPWNNLELLVPLTQWIREELNV